MSENNKATPAEKPKRKTRTSTAVKRRYNNKVYSRVRADLPKELVVAVKEKIKANGTTTADVLRKAIERYIEENENATKHIYTDKEYARIYADLPKELAAKFKETVAANGTSTAAVLRKSLEEYLDGTSEN